MEINLQHLEENIDSIELLGKGTNGIAFRVEVNGIDFVLKLTSSESEYKIALSLKKYQNKSPHILKISSEIVTAGRFSRFTLFISKIKNLIKNKIKGVDVDKLTYKYFILTEYLKVDNKTKKYSETKLYGKLFKKCIENKLTISELLGYNNKQLKEFFNNNYDATDKFIEFNTVINILKLHKTIGANDFHSGNIGLDVNGNIKAFDFDMAFNRKFKL